MQASTLCYFAAETAANVGSLTIQAEFTGVLITDAVQPYAPAVPVERGDPVFYGGYVEALWFLTGEHSAYDTQRATFDRVTPFENFYLVSSNNGRVNGCGAWQVGVALRFRQAQCQRHQRRNLARLYLRGELVLEPQYESAIQLRLDPPHRR